MEQGFVPSEILRMMKDAVIMEFSVRLDFKMKLSPKMNLKIELMYRLSR